MKRNKETDRPPAEQTVLRAARELQQELDRTLLEALEQIERLHREVWELYLELSPILDPDQEADLRVELALAEGSGDRIGEKIERIFSLVSRIERRERELETASDPEGRALLESLRLADILDKNLLILRTILAIREAIGELDRIERRLTTV